MLLFVIVLSIGLTEALILSPEDYKQSDAVRIMYVHVPAAWISLGIFTSITFLSISASVNPTESTITNNNKTYFGAFEVILKILFGSKNLNIFFFRFILRDTYYEKVI